MRWLLFFDITVILLTLQVWNVYYNSLKIVVRKSGFWPAHDHIQHPGGAPGRVECRQPGKSGAEPQGGGSDFGGMGVPRERGFGFKRSKELWCSWHPSDIITKLVPLYWNQIMFAQDLWGRAADKIDGIPQIINLQSSIFNSPVKRDLRFAATGAAGLGFRRVNGLKDLSDVLKSSKPGDTISIAFQRDREEKTVKATVVAR